MQYRLSKTVAIGVAAVLSLGFAGSAAAQVTSDTVTRSKTTVTSSRRISVRKDGTTSTEQAGTLVPNADSLRADSIANAERMRQDSIANAERVRQDSIANAERIRQDSIATAERLRQEELARIERARQDSIAAAEAARLRQLAKGNVYFRLGAGVSLPQADFADDFKNGFNVTGSAGWHKWNSPLGLRLDVGYDRFSLKGASENASILSGVGDVTLKIPQVLAVSPYLVAGGGIYRLSSSGAGSTSNTKGGWNAGGGLTFGVGMAKLFIEGRYTNVSTEGVATKFIPVILGISF
jgi:hypothetical protein